VINDEPLLASPIEEEIEIIVPGVEDLTFQDVKGPLVEVRVVKRQMGSLSFKPV